MTHCVFGNKRLLRYLNACFSSACELPSLAKGPVCLVNDLECKWLSARLTFSLLGTRQVEFCGPPEICSLPAICPPTCGNWAQPVLSVCVLFPSGGGDSVWARWGGTEGVGQKGTAAQHPVWWEGSRVGGFQAPEIQRWPSEPLRWACFPEDCWLELHPGGRDSGWSPCLNYKCWLPGSLSALATVYSSYFLPGRSPVGVSPWRK